MCNNKLITISCQFDLAEEKLKEQLLTIPQYIKSVNDEYFDSIYTTQELSTILMLNCSNDVEYLAKLLQLKTSKYGTWRDGIKGKQFYYNQIALARFRSYLSLLSLKTA